MQRIFSVALALLLGSIAGSAKASGQIQDQSRFASCIATLTGPNAGQCVSQVDINRVAVAPVCPVPMSARQSSSGNLISVAPGQPAESRLSQHIHLTLGGKDSPRVASARVTVRGLTSAPRSTLLSGPLSGAEGPSSIRRTLNVTFNDGTGEQAADLKLLDFTAVLSIELDALTYADGKTWTENANACRVKPDSLMLVGSR
jgi:hypothetical protein